MPNSSEHGLLGTFLGVGLCLREEAARTPALQNVGVEFKTQQMPDLLRILGFALIGGLCAQLPDMMEPATSPNHRGPCHSWAALALLWYAAFGQHSQAWSPEQRLLIRTVAATYGSHLALDALTPKSLPLV